MTQFTANSAASFAPGGPFSVKLTYACFVILALLLCFPGPLSITGGFSLGTLFCGMTGVIALDAVQRRSNPVYDPLARRGILLVLGCGLFISLWSILSVLDVDLPIRAGRVIVTHVYGALICLIVYAVFTPQRGLALLNIVSLTLALICYIVFLSYFVDALRPTFFKGTDRAFGFFRHPNQFGMVLATLTPIALAMLLTARNLKTVTVRLATFSGLCFGLIACGSKTNILLFVCTSLTILVLAPFLHATTRDVVTKFVRNLAIAALVAVAGFIFLENFNPRAIKILEEFLVHGGQVRSLETREAIWAVSVQQFVKDPLFGQGAGQTVYEEYPNLSHSHNAILDYMRTLGVPGVTAIAVIIITCTYLLSATVLLAYRAKYADCSLRLNTIAIALGALSYIAANMTSDSFGPTTSPFFWMAAYIAFAMRRELAPPDPRA